MGLYGAKLPSLKDEYRELTNKEIEVKTDEIKKETKEAKEKVAKKK